MYVNFYNITCNGNTHHRPLSEKNKLLTSKQNENVVKKYYLFLISANLIIYALMCTFNLFTKLKSLIDFEISI